MLGKRVSNASSTAKEKIIGPFHIRQDDENLVGASKRAWKSVRCNQIKKKLVVGTLRLRKEVLES